MSLFFEVKSSEKKPERTPIRIGATIGRKDCDLSLRDPKVSSLHARVEEGVDGSLLLVDQRSSNGLSYQGRKVPSIELKVGVQFSIASFLITVVEEAETDIPPDLEEWRTHLLRLTLQAAKLAPVGAKTIRPFTPPLRVEEVGGDLSYLVGYGPRKCGSGGADLHFSFSNPEPLEFEIFPDEDGNAMFSTRTPQHLRLNGKPTSNARLQDGDLIAAVGKRIRIRFVETSGKK